MAKKKKKKLQRQYNYTTESLKKIGKKKNLPLPQSLTQPGLPFDLLLPGLSQIIVIPQGVEERRHSGLTPRRMGADRVERELGSPG